MFGLQAKRLEAQPLSIHIKILKIALIATIITPIFCAIGALIYSYANEISIQNTYRVNPRASRVFTDSADKELGIRTRFIVAIENKNETEFEECLKERAMNQWSIFSLSKIYFKTLEFEDNSLAKKTLDTIYLEHPLFDID